LAYGPGFRNDLGIRAFGQLSYTNLWGMNHTVSVNASANRRFYLYNFAEGQIQVSYLWPWFLGAPNLTFRPTLSIAQTQYINFAADTVTASALWEKPFLPNPSLIGSVAYTVEKIRQFNAVADIDNKQLLICSVTPRLTLDLRDNPLSPTSGLFSTAWVDLAEPFLGTDSDIGLYRVQFRTDYHIPIFKGVVLYLSLRSGYEQSVLGGQSIPLIKQFALGGIGSLRGFQEQSLNYQTSLTPVTTLSYVNYRTQLDLPFSGALKFGVFFDAANLMQDSFSFSKSLRSGTGIGFHYQTPVGPVNLDLGFNTAPQAGESPYVIHFSVGII
jgi:outer membrane protein assembly factor BamA